MENPLVGEKSAISPRADPQSVVAAHKYLNEPERSKKMTRGQDITEFQQGVYVGMLRLGSSKKHAVEHLQITEQAMRRVELANPEFAKAVLEAVDDASKDTDVALRRAGLEGNVQALIHLDKKETESAATPTTGFQGGQEHQLSRDGSHAHAAARITQIFVSVNARAQATGLCFKLPAEIHTFLALHGFKQDAHHDLF